MSTKLGMGSISVTELAAMIGVTPVYYGNDKQIELTGVDTDSRTVAEGDIFVAIPGEKYDGADFAASAVLSGARCVISSRCPDKAEELGKSFAFLQTEDPCGALSRFATEYKKRRRIRTVAVTGSVGKTTTKEMISAVLSQKFRVGKTQGNLNTDIGLSMTVLGFGPETEVAVLEMGMSNFGEIEKLSRIAEPDYGIITNVGTSHIEFLGSRENIAKAKSEIAVGLREDGMLVLCGDEPLLRPLAGGRHRTAFVSVYATDCEYRAENIRYSDMKTTFDLIRRGERIGDVVIPALGLHHVYGALFAAAIADKFGLTEGEFREGLLAFRNAAMRQSISDVGGVTVIDASYNASPESMRASLSVLCELAAEKNARKIALLGDMRELGSETRPQHEKVGEFAASLGLDLLVTFGIAAVCTAEAAKKAGMPAERVISELNIAAPEECARTLAAHLRKGDCLLVKASRAVAAEKIINYLKEHPDFPEK